MDMGMLLAVLRSSRTAIKHTMAKSHKCIQKVIKSVVLDTVIKNKPK